MRQSRKEPNIQNIPIRTPEGRKIRNAFIQSMVAQSVDYSEIEKRIMEQRDEDAD